MALNRTVCMDCCGRWLPLISHSWAMFFWLMVEVAMNCFDNIGSSPCPVNLPNVDCTWSVNVTDEPPEFCPYKNLH
jgi:hypothetical protein